MKFRGISTLDLAVYIVVATVLLATAWPYMSGYSNRGKRAQAVSQISAMSTAISVYKQQKGSYPSSLNDLSGTNDYGEPWIISLPSADPWDQAYAYDSSDYGFAVWSYGPNATNESTVPSDISNASFGGDDIGFAGE
jgi:Type II secretory pathway, pseudopilin PulG